LSFSPDSDVPGWRIAIGNIFTESNHLVGTRTELEDFARTELRRGKEILRVTDGVVGGALEVLRQRRIDIRPTLVASAYPGGILSKRCYTTLKEELLERLRKELPVSGVIAPLHGGAAVEHLGDLEGDLLGSVRKLVGPEVPVVATLDCHAHVTQAMVEHANALVAWETYPHRDTFETGVRGAQLLLDILDGRLQPVMALAKVPMIVSGFYGATAPPSPFAGVMGLAKSREGQGNIVSTSAFLVQPHLDLPDMGGGGLAISNGDVDAAVTAAKEVAAYYWEHRFDFEPPTWSPADAVAEGLESDQAPLLLLEVADCVGGGAAGDSVAALRALIQAPRKVPALAMLVDPEAQKVCRRAGVGAQVELELGHRVDPRWGAPLAVRAQVEKLTDGQFTYSGGIWEGEVGHMGPAAKIRIGAIEVLISTHGTYDWSDEQYTAMDMDTSAAKFIVVKNPMNYRVGYADRHASAYVLDTPGPTTALLGNVDFQRLERPYFPRDRDIPGLAPTVYVNHGSH